MWCCTGSNLSNVIVICIIIQRVPNN
jgi:hypothetical protein